MAARRAPDGHVPALAARRAGGLLLLARRSPSAPRYWFAYLAASAVYLLLDVLTAPFVHAQMERLVGAQALTEAGTGRVRGQLLRQLAATVAWALYWARSQRVRATFGTAPLDRTVATQVPAEGAMPSEAAATTASARPRIRDGRWWRRVVLCAAGGTLVTLVALLAVGLWSTRTSPCSVSDGADIGTVVTGDWTWSSDTAGCWNAHTIAFTNEGRVMTISSRGVGAADSVAIFTYDIKPVSRSTIRGAIRGETRKTDDGKPVVWDLVLLSPDEYRWKRTDWSASPWSYTGSIRRCPAPPRSTTASGY